MSRGFISLHTCKTLLNPCALDLGFSMRLEALLKLQNPRIDKESLDLLEAL